MVRVGVGAAPAARRAHPACVHHCVMGAEDDEQAEKTDELMAAVVGLTRRG